MSVLIGHASIDERGTAHGGAAGDQTGREVCTRAWWARGWNVCLRFKDPQKAEKAARFVEQCCAGNMVGYDQWQRNTLRDAARAAGWSGKDLKTKCETDCAAFMTVAAEAAGINMDSCYLRLSNGALNAPVTSTMAAKFRATGAFDVLTESKYLTTDRYLKRGDILVREDAHTVMVLSDGEGAAAPVLVNVQLPQLRKGDASESVSSLQILLNGWATLLKTPQFGCGAVDGIFGAKTDAAVRMFQGEFGLEKDGVVGEKTWATLLN